MKSCGYRSSSATFPIGKRKYSTPRIRKAGTRSTVFCEKNTTRRCKTTPQSSRLPSPASSQKRTNTNLGSWRELLVFPRSVACNLPMPPSTTESRSRRRVILDPCQASLSRGVRKRRCSLQKESWRNLGEKH